jgi:hypothetical protein
MKTMLWISYFALALVVGITLLQGGNHFPRLLVAAAIVALLFRALVRSVTSRPIFPRRPLWDSVVVFTVLAMGVLIFWFLAVAIARAGTCNYSSEVGYSVTARDNGSYTVRDQQGHPRLYGEPNAGIKTLPRHGK